MGGGPASLRTARKVWNWVLVLWVYFVHSGREGKREKENANLDAGQLPSGSVAVLVPGKQAMDGGAPERGLSGWWCRTLKREGYRDESEKRSAEIGKIKVKMDIGGKRVCNCENAGMRKCVNARARYEIRNRSVQKRNRSGNSERNHFVFPHLLPRSAHTMMMAR